MLDAARDGIIELFTSEILMVELERVLSRERFASRLRDANVTVRELVDGYSSLATVIDPEPIASVVIRDPDDDAVIACAVSSDCDFIVSGDEDLLSLRSYREIRIVSSTELLLELSI